MTSSFTSEGLQTLFLFPFKDPRWKLKLFVGSLFTLLGFIVPIIPLVFVYGYAAQIMRRIIVDGEPASLPEWEDASSLFKIGAKVLGVSLIYLSPFLVLFFFGYMAFFVPQFVLAVAESQNRHTPPGWEWLLFTGMFSVMGLFSLGFLGMLLIGVIAPPALAHVVATDRFSAAFHFSGWWPIFRANLGGFIISYVVLMGLFYAFAFVTQILYFTLIFCCLLPFAMSFFYTYLLMISSALFGQAYRDGVEKLSLPPPHRSQTMQVAGSMLPATCHLPLAMPR